MILIKKDPYLDFDELLEDAVKVCATYDQVAASLIQRRLSIGHARAAKIIDQLEYIGAIGKNENSGKPRSVLIKKNKELDKGKIDKEGTKENLIYKSELIKQMLIAHGIFIKIASISVTKTSINFFMEVAIGTKLDDLLGLEKELAMILSSPTGKVEMGVPFKGTSLVALFVPTKTPLKPTSYIVINENLEIREDSNNTFMRLKGSSRETLLRLSRFFEKLAYKI